jgi:streptomycin 6-kinase
VRLPDGADAVLKLALPHMEGEHEIAGLRYWAGEVTAQLLDADESRHAMLLERCVPGTPLRTLYEPEQDVVLAEMLPRLWHSPARNRRQAFAFRPLSEMIALWAGETRAAADEWPDPALVRAGLDVLEQLSGTSQEEVVLFTDLHAGNVLRAERAPWLAIDPKPFVGDPAYDATQHLFNCLDRMRAAPGATIDAFADRLGLDRTRVRGWTFARAAAEPRSDWATSPWLDVARQIAP